MELSKFRLGITELNCHKLRYCTQQCSLLCPFCHTDEFELHFVFICLRYTSVSHTLIDECPLGHSQLQLSSGVAFMYSDNVVVVDFTEQY